MNALVPTVNSNSSVQTRPTGLIPLQGEIYREARASRPLPRLLPWLVDRRNLEAAWERVRASDGAQTPGLDGVTAADVARDSAAWITRLADDLLRRRHRPGEPRWIDIPKPNKPGQFRRLGILTLRDRVVLAALKQILEPVLEPIFLPTSFGFRPGRSVPAALADALHRIAPAPGRPPAFTHGVHLDVADCFDTIDHRLLLAELSRNIADAEVIRLLEDFLRAGAAPVGRLFWRRPRGVVQGSGLSPLLCNLALHPLDQVLEELGRQTSGGLCALRYADDLLLLARDLGLARQGVAALRQVLGNLQQRLREPANRPAPLEQGVDWLGVRIQPRRETWSGQTTYGYVVPDAKVSDMLGRITEMTVPPSDRIDAAAFNLGPWIVSINEQLRDWRQAYLFADNAPAVFRAIDAHCDERVGALLQSVTGLRRDELARRYRRRLPRGFRTWETPGARLVVLSSLAPHYPGRLLRRPTWMTNRADSVVVTASDTGEEG